MPTAAFFKAAYDMETDSYAKRVQKKLADDLQRHWWRIRAEFDEAWSSASARRGGRSRSGTSRTPVFLKGDDREAWSETLAPFVWVNWSQLITTSKTLSLSGPMAPIEADSTGGRKRASWRSLYTLAGFESYFEQFTDTRGTIRRMLRAETEGDPYLQTLVAGLGAD